eukprot:1158285-Pelagomonas_calceolata.AAC.2
MRAACHLRLQQAAHEPPAAAAAAAALGWQKQMAPLVCSPAGFGCPHVPLVPGRGLQLASPPLPSQARFAAAAAAAAAAAPSSLGLLPRAGQHQPSLSHPHKEAHPPVRPTPGVAAAAAPRPQSAAGAAEGEEGLVARHQTRARACRWDQKPEAQGCHWGAGWWRAYLTVPQGAAASGRRGA